jgi:signal transduction histidine kinase
VPFRHALVRPRLSIAAIATAAVAAVTLLLSASPADASFEDTAGRSYEDAVTALVDAGVINGCLDERFCPERTLTRAQMASILVRGLEVEYTEFSYFDDLEANVHADNVNALAAAGITQGCATRSFCPGEPVTREQLATLLARAFELPAATGPHFDDVSSTHADGVDRVAEAGITAGCSARLTSFCGSDPVLRWQAAVFVARAMDLVDTVQLASFDERSQEQAQIDEAERQRQAELQAQQEAEAQAQREAEAAAERDRMWERLAQCESGGNWSINTGNGYYGGLQFSLSSWQWVGGSGYPHRATRAEQIRRAEILLSRQGWNAWPSCSRQLGYR